MIAVVIAVAALLMAAPVQAQTINRTEFRIPMPAAGCPALTFRVPPGPRMLCSPSST